MPFSELLLPSLRESLTQQGLTTPTPIQERSLEPLLQGDSVVGIAETGSGKTLAYVLPLLHTLKTLEVGGSSVTRAGTPRALVVVPARELGEQVSKVFKSLTHGTRLRVRVALGGSKKKTTRQNVAGVFEILVATPGRLTQLLDGGELSAEDVRTLVFDEADRLLDAGFLPVAQQIVKACARRPQMVMFSATLPQELEASVSALCPTPPVLIRTRGSQRTVPTLTTDNRTVLKGLRYEVLGEILTQDPTPCTMLFVNTIKQADKVAEWLFSEEIDFVPYRGQMDRMERRSNLLAFRDGQVSVLLTTDLGGRGLDIDRVERVINVHLPSTVDDYLHRVGRTARAGRSGTVINLVTQRDHPLLADLKKRS